MGQQGAEWEFDGAVGKRRGCKDRGIQHVKFRGGGGREGKREG